MVRFFLLAVLQVLHAAPPPANVCALIAREVPILRAQKTLKEPGTVRVHSGTYAFDRFANFSSVPASSTRKSTWS